LLVSFLCFCLLLLPLLLPLLPVLSNVSASVNVQLMFVCLLVLVLWLLLWLWIDRKHLPPEQRAYWDNVALKDKERFMMEKASYTGPWQVPWKRAKKDPSAPKRPMSAFLYFSQGRRSQLKQQNPELKNTEVSRLLGDLWRNATEEARRPFVEKELEEREKYKIAIAGWRKEAEARQEAQRRVKAEQLNLSAVVPTEDHTTVAPTPYGDPYGNQMMAPSHYMYSQPSYGYCKYMSCNPLHDLRTREYLTPALLIAFHCHRVLCFSAQT
jgi:HMG (high mobility group) box